MAIVRTLFMALTASFLGLEYIRFEAGTEPGQDEAFHWPEKVVYRALGDVMEKKQAGRIRQGAPPRPAPLPRILTDDFNPLEYYDAAQRESLRRSLAMGMKTR